MKKIWVGDSSHQENRPDRIEIRLLQDGKEYQKKMVYKSDNWKYEFSDLPKVDNSTGKEYKYTVEEVSVPKGYETSISGNNIINTYEEVDYIEFIGEKIWEDNGDRAGKRPSKVEVSLYQDGKEYRKQEVSSNNNWKYRFTELPKYHEGTTQPYEYEVKEVNVPEGYESIVQGNNIINRYTQTEQVSVSGKKVWNDSNNKANKRPESVTIKLLQDRKEYATTEATEKNDWRYSFTDLPKYDENGLLYRYTVEEVDVPEGYESDVNGTTITNTLLEKPVEMISIKGEKIWEDYNNVSNTRPENITVFLYRDDNYLRPYDEKKIEGGNSNRWSYEFTNLPKHDENGREYDYWVEEAKVDHYELTKLNEFDLLNKLNLQGKTKVTGEKIWDDENNEDKIRPDSVTVRLFANGQEVDSTSVSAKTQWKYSFDNLDKYDNQSVEIKYTVKEDKVAGYETKYDSKDNHTIITNKHSVADIFDIKGEKIWVGDEDNTHFRPYSIIIELYRNDSHYDSKTLYASDFEGNRWQYEFKDLEKADENGNLYEYTVQELLVPLNYDSEVDGYNIINTFKNKELIDIPVEKIWHDGNGKIKGRPSWLTVHLEHYENGRWYQSGDRVRLSEDNNWRYVYKNCYKYFDDGSLIEYRVVEEDSNGVLAPYESVTNGVQLINTLKPIKKAIRVTKNWRGEPKDEDGKVDTSFRPDFITINLYRNDVLIESRQLTEQNQNSQYSWVYEFQDLDVFDPVTFEKYVYTVEEEQVPNYESEISMSSNGSTATIFNTFKPTEKIDISGQKYWDDKNNGFDKPRPNEITIDLYQDNKLVDSTTTDASKDWKYEFKELLKFNPDTKEEYNYTVKENNVPNDYISNIEGYDIYNVYQNNKLTKVSGEKHWIDYQNKFNTRPESIEVKLYQNNKLHQTQVVKSNGTDRWQYSFENLKVYDNNGKEYIYHVEEDNVPNGYDSKIEGNTITNTYVNTEKTEISGNKIWNDYQNGFNTRPESITVELYNGNTKVKSQEVKPDQNGDWQYKFTNLPKYDDKGELITYTVKEVPVDSYETTIKGKDIINTYVNTEKTEISVEKKWQDEDNKLNLRPTSIKVNLLRNESVIKTEELSDANQWQHTFSDLDKYDNNGDEYRYTVVEEGIPHYLTTYETNNQKVTISNELNSNDTLTNLSGLKIWDDYNNKFGTRPDKIKVTLLQDGEVMLDKTGKPVSQEVSETTKWAYAFEDLPKINPVTKDDYLYTVKEDEVGNGYDKPIYEGSNITNRYRNKDVVTINGSKVWDDYNNKFLTRPESITVNLLQDNVVIKSTEASKEQDYAFTFDNLPKYDENGVLYEYKVIEDVPSPYTVEEKVEIIKEDNTMNVLLTNTYKNNETVELNGEKTWDDYENKFNTRPSTITVQLYNHDQYLESQQVVPDSNGDWTYSFKELPKYDNDGNLNKYSVKEVILNNEHGYTSEVVGNDLINHYVNKEIVNFKGQKIWNDYDNKFNTRPESVTIYLYKDKSRIETTTTDASKDWKYEFNNNYPVYDENGNEINYTIKEKSVKPYTTEVSESTSIKQGNETIVETNITNQYVNKETKTLSGDKTWDDFDNQFGNRPDSIVITLEAHNKATNETTYQTTNASKESNWKYEFINLPVYDELGEEIEYTISEETIDGYEQTQGAPKFINRAKELDAKTSISGKKIWKDENNKLKTRPESITVTLYQNDLPMLNDKNEVVTQVVDITTMWSYHFENLPKYDSEGKLYEYSVKESFSTGLDKYQTEVIGNDIVNTYINNEKIEVSGEKRWNDLDNKLGKRPSSIKVVLYQSGSEKPYQEKEVFPNESGDWFYVFSDLPKYDDELNLYTYRVEEKNVPHYETASEGKYDLVNTYINDEVTEVSGEKLWYDIDNKLNTRPESITVELYQNNGEKPFKTQEVKPNENGEWKYEFKELPKYDENYDLYEYTIKETPVAHYESQIYSDSPTTIYNRYINNETTNVKVIKKWDDEGNLLQTRPKSIRVNLYRNNGRIPYKTQTILPNENGMWSHEFKDLPKYDNNLELYEYTVKEMKVSDYTATVENDQTNNVSIITNTYTNPEKIEINGYKSWLDHDNKLGTRPASIFVDLFRSDSNKVYQTQEVVPNEDGYWFYSFKDLPKYDDKLQLYTYTVKEQPVEHYESQVSYPNIVNSYKNDETISLKGEKIWNDKENKLKTRPENITVELYQGNRLYDRKDVVADEDGKWLYEFSDLPKYNADLDEYIYTVREPKVPGYNTEITGTNITNHYQNNETVTVPVKKVWDDQSNKLNTRPSMIKIELYQNGGEKPYKVETLLPNGTDVWSHEFVNLPKYDEELNEYMYTVKEQPVAGYESSITGTTITNKYINNQFTSIKGEKKWEDQDNKLGTRPEKIYVDLYQGDSKKSMATEVVEADENGHWEYEFVNLPKYDDELNEYSYRVEEKKVPHYDTEIVGTTIVNRYRNDDKVDLNGKKVWKDLDNKLNTRPGKIKVDLYQNESSIPMKSKTVKADENGEWNYSFKDLPKYDDQLNEYRYSVKEQPVKGYESSVEGTTITNTYQNNEKTSISGKKVWKDENNILNSRPESIIVELHQNGAKEVMDEKEITADSEGNWSYSFTDLPKYDEQLEEYTYSVTEKKVPQYETNINGTTITNTYLNNETVTIEGQKTWKDQDNKLNTRPKLIKVDLYQNEGNKPYKTQTVKADDKGNWIYEFVDLPKYDEHLVEYKYTVKEQPVKNYDSEVVGLNIENTYQNTDVTSLKGEKTWDDLDNKLGKRPTEIFVELYQTTKETPEITADQKPFEVQKVKPNLLGNWEYEFTNLPKYDDKLDEYNYLVKEQFVKDYDSEITGSNIKNTYQNKETVTIDGQKIWKNDFDNKLNSRPESIVVNLYQNNSDEIYESQTVKPDENGNWNYSFKELPKYDNELNEFTYTVKEVPVSHYESKVKGTTITNTYQNTDVTTIKGQKQWNDEEDKLKKRPKSITVDLYQNDSKKPIDSQEVTAGADNQWRYEFKDLPKYDKELNEFVYTVKEHEVDDYKTTIEGTTIINTYKNVETTQVTGEKKWEDFDNKLNSRPSVITVDLYQNDVKEPYRSQVVVPDKNGKWNYTFKELPKYDENLNEYTYTVKEQSVPHYTSTVTGTDITNTYLNNDKINVEGKKVWKDLDNKLNLRPESIIVELYQNNGDEPFKIQEVSAGKNNDWNYSFKDLPKYDEELNEYNYTVKEKEVPHYETSIKGTTITNTYRNDDVTQVKGEKIWRDLDDKLNLRPETITVELYQNNDKKPFKTQEVSAGADNKWQYEFNDLPKYDENLNEYTYTVKEQTVPHYDSQIEGSNIINTYRNDDLIDLNGKKVWKDFDDKLKVRPQSITVELYQNGGSEPYKTQKVTAGSDKQWHYSFKDLPKYDNELNEYIYTVKEVEVSHYDTTIEGTTITNHYRNDDVTKVVGEKLWKDSDNKLSSRPETITIELYQNNDKQPLKTQEVKADENNHWRYSFNDLPKYDDQLNEFVYTVREKEVPHYDTSIEGTTITNTYRNDEVTEITGKKLWEDNNNKKNTRPDSIVVEVYQNDGKKAYQSQVVKPNKDGAWLFKFTDLPKYDKNLNEYRYSIKEIPVKGYQTRINGTTIVNTLVDEKIPTKPVDPKKPGDGYLPKTGENNESLLASLLGISLLSVTSVGLYFRRRKY